MLGLQLVGALAHILLLSIIIILLVVVVIIHFISISMLVHSLCHLSLSLSSLIENQKLYSIGVVSDQASKQADNKKPIWDLEQQVARLKREMLTQFRKKKEQEEQEEEEFDVFWT